MNEDVEIWKPVVGYEGYYEVSSLGRIRTLDHMTTRNGWPRKVKGRIKVTPIWGSYKFVSLCVKQKKQTFTVHRLVALAFVPNPESHYSIDHINGNEHDNRACNLEWCSLSENTRRQWNLGKAKPAFGERNGSAILCEDQVREARIRFSGGESCPSIALTFGVKPATINAIVRRENWRHVQ